MACSCHKQSVDGPCSRQEVAKNFTALGMNKSMLTSYPNIVNVANKLRVRTYLRRSIVLTPQRPGRLSIPPATLPSNPNRRVSSLNAISSKSAPKVHQTFLFPSQSAHMEALLARHRKEAQDLQARVTQKKKSATKKTRKAVNDECDSLERELKTRQEGEIKVFKAAQNGAVEEGLPNGSAENDAAEEEELKEGEKENGKPAAEDMEGQDNDRDSNIHGSMGKLSLYGDPETRQQRKPNRQKARLARRAAEREELARQAAEEAESLPDLREREREVMVEQFQRRGLTEKVVRADGHCLYAAVAEGLSSSGLGLRPQILQDVEGSGEDFKVVRTAAAKYIEKHPDDFVPFLEESIDDYVTKVRDTGEWGGQLELLALSKAYGVDISVIQGDGTTIDIEGDGESDNKKRIWLAYYKHNFGLGEHYNSLRQAS